MKTIVELVKEAQNIGIASGEAMDPCQEAFEAATDLEVPLFNGEKLWAESEGRTFWKLRGYDIPGYVQAGWLDAGVAGTDACIEDYPNNELRFFRIGKPMCYFALLAEAENTNIRSQLIPEPDSRKMPLKIPTTNAPLLAMSAYWRDLALAPLDGPDITGKGEAAAKLSGVGCVADIVRTGKTSQANGLSVVLKLCDIYPELVVRSLEC